MNKIHLTTLYSIAVALAPILFWVDARFAHAEDVSRTNAQIMLEVQQISLDSKVMTNELRLDYYSEKINEGRQLNQVQEREFDLLQEHKLQLLQQQVDLNRLRQEIK